MSTVSKDIADKVIAGDYSDGPAVIGIIEYTNVFNGGLAYKLVYQGQDIEHAKERIMCKSAVVYWRK